MVAKKNLVSLKECLENVNIRLCLGFIGMDHTTSGLYSTKKL